MLRGRNRRETVYRSSYIGLGENSEAAPSRPVRADLPSLPASVSVHRGRLPGYDSGYDYEEPYAVPFRTIGDQWAAAEASARPMSEYPEVALESNPIQSESPEKLCNRPFGG